MGNVFGNGSKKSSTSSSPTPSSASSASDVTEHDRAVLELKRQKDRLSKYRLKVEKVIEREVFAAKTLLKQGKKSTAVLALKRKKYQEGLLIKIEGEMENLTSLVNSIEFATVSKQVFDALQAGNQVLQALNDEISIEKVENLMEETAEAIQVQNQISELLGTKLTVEDEEAVEKALEELEVETLKEQLPEVKAMGKTGVKEQTEAVESKQEEKEKQKAKTKEVVLA
jgi:charged multivesicular body protein 6